MFSISNPLEIAGRAFNPNSEVEQSDLTQSTDRKEVLSILGDPPSWMMCSIARGE
jgi:hypothetical protein